MTEEDRQAFDAVLDAYAREGWPHDIIGQWTLPANDVGDLLRLIRDRQPKKILEVGTFVGLSTMLMAKAAGSGTSIFSIDPNFPLSVEMGSMRSRTGCVDSSMRTHDIARAVAKRLGLDHAVSFFAGGFSSSDSFAARRTNPGLKVDIVGPSIGSREGPFDFIFIDGLHYANIVHTDLELAARHLAPGGLIAVHDCIGMWGSNVRAGISRFLAAHPDWRFLHQPFSALYRSIGLVFRPVEASAPGIELLQAPSVSAAAADLFEPMAVALTRAFRPRRVIEICAGPARFAPYFDEGAKATAVGIEDSSLTRIDHLIVRAKGEGIEAHDILLISAGALDCLAEPMFRAVLGLIAETGVQGAFLRTPPGELGAACVYSRPIRTWVSMTKEAGASLRRLNLLDLAPSTFAFKSEVEWTFPTTSLSSAVHITARSALPENDDEALTQAELIEQCDLLHVHYTAGFNALFAQLTAASKNPPRVITNLMQDPVAADLWSHSVQRRAQHELRLCRKLARTARTIGRNYLDCEPAYVIEDALIHAAEHSFTKPTLILSWTPPSDEQKRLSEDLRIGPIGLKADWSEESQLDAAYFGSGDWKLPPRCKVVYFVGPVRLITVRMLAVAWRAGVEHLFCRAGAFWIRLPLGFMYRVRRRAKRAIRPFERVREKILELDMLKHLGDQLPVRIDRMLRPKNHAFAKLASRLKAGADAVPGRIVLVCGNLSAGGAERQAANTVIGLSQLPGLHPVLLAHDLDNGQSRRDFHLARVLAAGVDAREIRRDRKEHSPVYIPPRIPASLAQDIRNLVHEFEELKPAVVHAWLDWDNVRAGLAAVLAGVPRIILSGRNLAPHHFEFYQTYMKPAYTALLTHPNVRLINNSKAGARDYAEWLGIPHQEINVVRNGYDFPERQRPDAAARVEGLSQWGFPPDALVVGGVFRFSEEKRPLLWLETAARIAAIQPAARFVIYGRGSMLGQIQARAMKLGIGDRLALPGLTEDPLSAMALMDVFLLTSSEEGLPNVLIEAQSVGTPVVCTQAGGAPEAVAHGKSGMVVKTAGPEDLAEGVVYFLNSPDMRRAAAESGPPFIRDVFGMERMLSETLDAYGMGRLMPGT